MLSMQSYKEDFIGFMVRAKALEFGEFQLKSGRTAPYFFNAGAFCTGEEITVLGEFYAQAAVASGVDFDVLFGPAYKGIPLAVATASALFRNHKKNVAYAFNRKERKSYGMKDLLVGAKLREKSRVLLIDDVVTAGTAIRESIEMLQSQGVKKPVGILIALDRMEKNNDGEGAVAHVEKSTGVKVFSIVSFGEVIEYLQAKAIDGKVVIDDACNRKILKYREKYGIDK